MLIAVIQANIAIISNPGVGFGVAVGRGVDVGVGAIVGVAVGGNGVGVGVGVGVGDGVGVGTTGFKAMARYTGWLPTDMVFTTEPMLPGRPLVSITDTVFESAFVT